MFHFQVFGLLLDFYGNLYIPFLKHFFPFELQQRLTLNYIAEQMHLLLDLSLLKPLKAFLSHVEALKSPKLQVKVFLSAFKVTLSFLFLLLNINDFESDNSEEKKYKIESFENGINLRK